MGRLAKHITDDCHVKQIPSNFIYIQWPKTEINYLSAEIRQCRHCQACIIVPHDRTVCHTQDTQEHLHLLMTDYWVHFLNNSSVILLTVYNTILKILAQKISYWIKYWSHTWYFSLFSSLVSLILYWYCNEN